jgi:hypothetical protein
MAIWHSEFSTRLMKLVPPFLTHRKFKFSVGEISAHSETAAGVPQGSVLVPVLYSLHINCTPAAPGTHLAMFAVDTCKYLTQKQERRVLCKLQRGLTLLKSWCER